MDGGIWMPCPQTIGGLPCPPGLVSTLESCVAAPNGGMNDLTIAGSPRGSSATGAEVNASVSHPFVEVRSTLGLPAILLITGTGTSVGSVSASKVDQQEDGPRLPHVGRNQRLPRVTLPRAAQQVACEKSKAPPLPEDRSTTIVCLASPLRPSFAVIAAVEVRIASSVCRSGPRFPTTVTNSSPEDRSTVGNGPSAMGSSPEDRSEEGVRAGLPLDAPLGAGTLAAGALLRHSSTYWYSQNRFSTYLVRTCTICTPGLPVTHPPGFITRDFTYSSFTFILESHSIIV